MDHDKKHGEGTLCIGKAGNMEGAAERWTIQLAAPATAATATVTAPAAMEAT